MNEVNTKTISDNKDSTIENESDYELYAVYHNDKVNSILAIILKTLDHTQRIALKDALVERTPQRNNF